MSFLQQSPWQTQALASSIFLYFASLIVYRLFLHPLAKFPGPKLAAITRYYEGYYDLVQNGQYTFRIAEMHKQYGKPFTSRRLNARLFGWLGTNFAFKARS